MESELSPVSTTLALVSFVLIDVGEWSLTANISRSFVALIEYWLADCLRRT